jgi:hypothetical protein
VLLGIFKKLVLPSFGFSAKVIVVLILPGYGEAAVKLQRDWNVDAEQLPFAHHIKGRALINLVQKGLRYHHLSLTIDEVSLLPQACQDSPFLTIA